MASPNSRRNSARVSEEISIPAPLADKIPGRYSIRKKGEERELVCNESPTLAVRIERGKTMPAGTARKATEGTIYLDGAAEGGPFLDLEKGLINLDHHEGCVRSFTLATCEQAMVVVRKGVDLQRRDWTINANDPDLDTVLAIWVLLNHVRLNDAEPEIRRKIMPLLRLQGAIDAHGLEMQELCGFPPELQDSVFAELERLRSKEVALKKEGRWNDIDFLDYTAEVLGAIDAMIYSSHHFEGVLEVEELARAKIGEGLVVVCRGEAGIYEVEPHLRRLHGKRLGVIVLQKDARTYTLRQVDAFLPATLEKAYDWLNMVDPAAGNRRSGNRWGGSLEIGGSPRATGTSLTPQQIAHAFARAYRRPTKTQRLRAVGITVAESAAVVAGAIAATYLVGWLGDPAGSVEGYLRNHAGTFAGMLLALSGAVALAALRRGPRFFGVSMPIGLDWLILVPAALLGGLAGGAWVLATPITSGIFFDNSWTTLASVLGFPIAAEVLFRGLAHGRLAQLFPTQRAGGRWFLSWPVFISSLLYALWSLLPFLPFLSRGAGLTFAAALVFGVSSGMIRERSESLLPCLVLHVCFLLVLALTASQW